MKRGLILTCGTSVLATRHPPRTPAEEADPLRVVLHGAWQQVAPHYAGLVDEEQAARLHGEDHVLTVERFDLRPWEEAFLGTALSTTVPAADARYGMSLRALGVEAESLVRRIHENGPPRPSGERTTLVDEDRVALLVSQTLEGVLSGLLIAMSIGRGVRVWRSPRPTPDVGRPLNDVWTQVPIHSERGDADGGAAPVDVFIIDGLTVESQDEHRKQLRDSAVALCQVLLQTLPAHADRIDGWSDVQDVEVELSGGYKATLPLMHSLLGYFGTFVGENELTVFLRHERAPDNWIPSALRRLPREEVKRHLRELRQVREAPHRDPSGPLVLHGFGWVDRRGSRDLTPEGHGILQLQRLIWNAG